VSKPRLLELFCGPGGAARGYQLAGFHVTGVDVKPQPNYCGDEFILASALDLPLDRGGYDAIHASPPCMAYANVTRWRGDQNDHPRLIAPTRERLKASGLPWVIENVRTTELHEPVMVCGTRFGLPIRRHRYFESSFPLEWFGEPCQHRPSDRAFEHKDERAYADAMGCEWMNKTEARQAIPPAYTFWVGRQLLAYLGRAVPGELAG
jgi:DNA (cytosine-5)-methyltransferase 1